MTLKSISISLFVITATIFAQEEEIVKSKWKRSVVGGLNLTQTNFDNWAAGGENAFSWQLNFNYKFEKDTEVYSWVNTGKLAYGNTKTGDTEMIKSADEIKAESVFTYKLGSSVNPYAAVTGETQLAKGFDYSTSPATDISAFMDPAYLRESLGAGLKLGEMITTRAGASLKQTITSEYPIYSDDVETPLKQETLRSEFGVESVTDINWPVTKTSLYTGKLELFSGFNGLYEVDVNFDNVLTVKVTDFVNMNMNLKILYDKDISLKRQIKQTMAIGLNYTFI